MEDGWLLQFHEDLETCVTRVVSEMRVAWPCGCKMGNVDASSVILRYLWQKYLCKRPAVPDADTCRCAIKEVETSLLPLIMFKANLVEEQDNGNREWYECLKGQENKVLVFATSPRILDYLRPLIKALEEDFVLLSTTPVPDDFGIPSHGTVIRLRMLKAKFFRNAEMEQTLPWFYNFANAIGWFIEILKPRLLVCMDGCQSEYRLAAAFCNEKHIPSVCLQLGWPSYLHTGFRDLPYTHFLTWGDKFNPLWEKYNKHTCFVAAGYMDEAIRNGQHRAITFFLQAPVYLNTEIYLDRMSDLIRVTATHYPDISILVREHPEYRGNTRWLSRFLQCSNVSIVNNDKLADVYARTKVVVSHFSSVLMEGLMYGCTPLVFNPTPGSSYYPDIEAEGIGFISKNEVEFFSKLPSCLRQAPLEELPQWFKATGKEAVDHIIKIIDDIMVEYEL